MQSAAQADDDEGSLLRPLAASGNKKMMQSVSQIQVSLLGVSSTFLPQETHCDRCSQPAAEALVLERRQPKDHAQVLKTSTASVPDEDEAAAIAARRRAAARAKAQQSSSDDEGEAQVLRGNHLSGAGGLADDEEEEDISSGSSDGDSDSDSDSDSSSEYGQAVPLPPPVFVRKAERSTVKDEAELEAEAQAQDAERLASEKARKKDSRKLVALRTAEAAAERELARQTTRETIPVDLESGDETEELNAWRTRELKRMQRERSDRAQWTDQKAEVERRRAMGDDEILAEDGIKGGGEKTQLKFLQRYYHKGAFYQDELKEEFGDQDFNAPTGVDADIGDKSLLPGVMQVRSNWALKGRTKYTHLTDQDTTYSGGDSDRRRFGSLPEEFQSRMDRKRGGTSSTQPSANPRDEKKFKK